MVPPKTRTHYIRPLNALLLTTIGLTLASCGDTAKLSIADSMGSSPTLPQPQSSLIPTVNIASVKGWSAEQKPVAAEGTQVNRFADGLDHPRWIYKLPNGDVLVAESSAPESSDKPKGVSIRGWFMTYFMHKAGSRVPSADRITLLRDTDGDGSADHRSVFLQNLRSPIGMVLVGNNFYVANADSLVKFPYKEGEDKISAQPEKIVDLPAGLNHHWCKNVIAGKDGSKLYVTVGSNSNVGENGMDVEKDRAAILEVDPAAKSYRVFASGLRNPNGLAWEPHTGALWTAVNERDEIGSDLVPDYITSVKEGGFYGWPYSYYGQHVDDRIQPQNEELVAKAIVPDYALGAHTASLGLATAHGNSLPGQFKEGMFVGQHGSWNRKPKSGYKVIFVPFENGKPSGKPVDVLTGFLDADEKALGRPVGVALDQKGALLVADDVGNVIWRVTSVEPQQQAAK